MECTLPPRHRIFFIKYRLCLHCCDRFSIFSMSYPVFLPCSRQNLLFCFIFIRLILNLKFLEKSSEHLFYSRAFSSKYIIHTTCVVFADSLTPARYRVLFLPGLFKKRPKKGFCVGLALCSLPKTNGKIIYQDYSCHTTNVVQLMSMLIFIINGGTSGQSACDCGQVRRPQDDLLDRVCHK